MENIVDLDSKFQNILHKFFGKSSYRSDGLIIKIDNDTVYRFGVDGEGDVNKFNAENLVVLEDVIDKYSSEKFKLKKPPVQSIEISLYWKATTETFTYKNGNSDIEREKYTIGDS